MRTLIIYLLCCVGTSLAKPVTCEQLQIDVPATWQQMRTKDPMLYAARDPQTGATIQVGLMRFTPAATSISDSRIKNFRQGFTQDASRVISDQDTTIANHPAFHVEAETIKPAGPVQISSWAVLADPGIYAVILAGLPDAASRQAVIDSIRIASPEGSEPALNPSANAFRKVGVFLFWFAVVAVVFSVFRPKRKRQSI